MLSVGSLFAGIGGFDLGLERAGMRVAWQCESEDFCQRVLAQHWPGVPCYPDVRELRGAEIESVDLLCGGFPCQDISLVGFGGGINGTRSGLWSEYARLVGELRPRYVVVENVPALLVRGLERVLGDLAALGYDAEWDCLPASAFGAPHRRDRIWIVAYPSGTRRRQDTGSAYGDEGADARRSSQDDHQPGGNGEGYRAWPLAYANEGGRLRRTGNVAVTNRRSESSDCGGSAGWWAVEPGVGRVADGVPARVDRLTSLGNALVPQIAEWIGRRILEWEAVSVCA